MIFRQSAFVESISKLMRERVRRGFDKMLVKVKTLMGKEFEVYVNPRDKISRVKRRIESKERIPAEQQCLILAGRQMADDKTVNYYSITDGTVIQLVLELKVGFEVY